MNDECELTPKYVESVIHEMFYACALARAAGGIALEDVINQTKEVPAGWWFDFRTQYYLSPDVQFYAPSRLN